MEMAFAGFAAVLSTSLLSRIADALDEEYRDLKHTRMKLLEIYCRLKEMTDYLNNSLADENAHLRDWLQACRRLQLQCYDPIEPQDAANFCTGNTRIAADAAAQVDRNTKLLDNLRKERWHRIKERGDCFDIAMAEEKAHLGDRNRYFIVDDDVWDVKTCKKIKLALIENCCGSRVITTTCKFDVAEEAGEVYTLKPLSYENSKKLLYTRIFGADGQYHDNKSDDDISDKILKKCAGVPLAIIAVGSLLAGIPKDKWSEVYSYINSDLEDTMTLLSFSYYDMLSYPEDSYIGKDTLIWKWIAEGFVYEKQGERLFELGERYFNDLINRSMIQAVDERSQGIVSGCHVHDIVLDLLRMISLEENFVAILDDNTSVRKIRSIGTHNSPRYVEFAVEASEKGGAVIKIGSHVIRVPNYLSVHHPLVQMVLFARNKFADTFACCKSMAPKSIFDMAKRLQAFALSNWWKTDWNLARPKSGSHPSDTGASGAVWIAATAAPHHATGNRNLLSGFIIEHDELFVHAVDGVPRKVLARGAVITDSVVLADVWFVPGIAENLVSVSQLVDLDHSVSFSSGKCCIRRTDGKVVGKGRLQKGGIYVLDFLKVPLAI